MTGDDGLLLLLYSGWQLHESRLSLPMRPNLMRPTFLASQTIMSPAAHLMGGALAARSSTVSTFSEEVDAQAPSRRSELVAMHVVTDVFVAPENMSFPPICSSV